MEKRPYFALASVLFCALLSACSQPHENGSASPAMRPNIVLFVVEDLGPRIGAYGDPLAVTPNIDRLAAQGIRYTRAFTTSGVCAPSRAALITGMYQHTIGAQHMRTSSFGRTRSGDLGEYTTPGPAYETVPPPEVKAFPELLRAAGYWTLNNSKTDYQFGEPFTIWDAHSSTARLEERDPDKPFFAMFSSSLTHESGLFREGFADKLPKSRELAASNRERLSQLDARTDPTEVTVPGYLPDTPEVRTEIARHYDNIRLMDRWVGERLAELEATGQFDNTIVVWTTDHGDGFPRAKRSLYDSGLHVPLIVRFPDGYGAGSIADELVSFVDLAPTFLAMAGAEVPAHLHGRDLFDPDGPRRQYVHAARDRIDEWPDRVRAVRDERFKYLRNFLPERPFFGVLYYRENLASMAELRRLHGENALPESLAAYFETPRPAEELYDLENDPDELANLAANPAYAADLERLRAELDRWLADAGDTSIEAEEIMVTETMWPGGIQPVTSAPEIRISCENGSGSVRIESATDGASLAYRLAGDKPWLLYAAPVTIDAGTAIEARAVRYGYAPSETISANCSHGS